MGALYNPIPVVMRSPEQFLSLRLHVWKALAYAFYNGDFNGKIFKNTNLTPYSPLNMCAKYVSKVKRVGVGQKQWTTTCLRVHTFCSQPIRFSRWKISLKFDFFGKTRDISILRIFPLQFSR